MYAYAKNYFKKLKEDSAANRGSMEEYDHQLYRRPQMTGQAKEEECKSIVINSKKSYIIPERVPSRWRHLQERADRPS